MVVGNAADGRVAAATPTDALLDTVVTLRDTGEVRRARLGVKVVDRVDDDGVAVGAEVASVEPDGPAAAAGLVAGDVVVTVADREVDDASDVVSELREHRPGATVRIDVRREGRPVRIIATLG